MYHLDLLRHHRMMIFFVIALSFSNDSFEGEPEEKRRKTTNVVIDQPATEHKVLIDNVPDNSSLLEEVRSLSQVRL